LRYSIVPFQAHDGMGSKRPPMSDPFLQQFEKRRVELESRMLRMPTAAQIVQRWGGTSGIGQQYLHALPTVTALLEILAKSPRTAGTFRDRIERAGPSKIRHHEIDKCFCCFGLAFLYRTMFKQCGDQDLSNLCTRVATLAILSPAELEKVDWVARTFSHRHPDGSKDVLAPAQLMLHWITGSDTPQKTYQCDWVLQRYFEFLTQAWQAALQHQIHLQFPW
jgi:hypothetical protein